MNHSDLNFCPTFFCLLFTCFSLHPKDTEWSRVQPITFDHTSSNHLLSTERRKRHENNPVWLLKRFEFWRSCFLSFVTCDFETWNDWYGWYWCIDAMCRPSRLRSPERECWASEDGQHVPPRSGFFDVFLRKKHRKVHKRKKTEKHVSTNGKFLVWSTNRKTLRKLHLRYQLHVLMLYNGRDTDPSIGQWWWPAVFFLNVIGRWHCILASSLGFAGWGMTQADSRENGLGLIFLNFWKLWSFVSFVSVSSKVKCQTFHDHVHHVDYVHQTREGLDQLKFQCVPLQGTKCTYMDIHVCFTREPAKVS